MIAPTVAGVYIGMVNSAAGGIEICSSSTQYIDFTIINSDYRGVIMYMFLHGFANSKV